VTSGSGKAAFDLSAGLSAGVSEAEVSEAEVPEVDVPGERGSVPLVPPASTASGSEAPVVTGVSPVLTAAGTSMTGLAGSDTDAGVSGWIKAGVRVTSTNGDSETGVGVTTSEISGSGGEAGSGELGAGRTSETCSGI
jgi:hypothetical protein